MNREKRLEREEIQIDEKEDFLRIFNRKNYSNNLNN
jgi:hypothetical protein